MSGGPHSFHERPHERGKGAAAEAEAVRWLERQGYRVVERNVFTKAGEIDVVARDGETLCFLEVKARTGPGWGPAIAAVTAGKRRRLARAAALYLVHRPTEAPCRFDVLGLDEEDGEWRFTLVKDAFRVGE